MRRLLAVLLLCIPGIGVAQVRGTVRDEAGRPVPEAYVELLSAGARLAVTETDTAGAFSFAAASTAAAVVVRKIGYLPARLPLRAVAGPIVITLRTRNVPVAGVTVEAPGACVERDHPEARRLWQRAAHRYASGALMAGLFADRMVGSATVPSDSFGVMDTARAARGHIAMTGLGLRPQREPDRFYARPPLIGGERSYQWDYAWLESVLAWHFADRLFGELNRLELAPPEVGDMVIVFCSARGSRPYITGRLYVGPDTTLLKAEWRFVTERPAERAGGEVVFMPPAPGAPLLAASGQFWRAKAFGFYQEWSSYLQWYACEGFNSRCAPEQRRPLGR